MGIQEDRQEDRKGPLTGKDLSDQSSWEDLDRFERLGEKLRIHNLSMGAACNVPEDVDFVCSTPGGERLTSSAISKATQKIQIAQKEEEEKEHAHKRLIHQIEELNRQIAELEAKIAKLTEEIDALNEKLSAQEKKFKAEFGPNWREEIQKPENKNRSDVLIYNQNKQTRDDKAADLKTIKDQLDQKIEERAEALRELPPEQRKEALPNEDRHVLSRIQARQQEGTNNPEAFTIEEIEEAQHTQSERGVSAEEAKQASVSASDFLSAFSKKKTGAESYNKPIKAETGLPDLNGDFAKVKDIPDEKVESKNTLVAKAEVDTGPTAGG